jgi:hypothetical protein
MHRKVAAALVAALALGIASCGGSEEALTRAQLVRKIEVACRHGGEVVDQQSRASARDRSRSPEAAASRFVNSVLAGQEAIVSDVEDLTAPDAARDEFDAFKDGLRERAEAVRRAATSGDVRRAVADVQASVEVMTRRIRAAADALGVEGCV